MVSLLFPVWTDSSFCFPVDRDCTLRVVQIPPPSAAEQTASALSDWRGNLERLLSLRMSLPDSSVQLCAAVGVMKPLCDEAPMVQFQFCGNEEQHNLMNLVTQEQVWRS